MSMALDEELEVLAEYCADGRRRALEFGNRALLSGVLVPRARLVRVRENGALVSLSRR